MVRMTLWSYTTLTDVAEEGPKDLQRMSQAASA